MLGRLVFFLIAGLTVFAICYQVGRTYVLDRIPKDVMAKIETRIAARAGGSNKCNHNTNYGPRRGTVARANPDSIVTSMAYDLSEGPIEVKGKTWPEYWSLSVYQHNTDNIFVINDGQLETEDFHIIISPKGTQPDIPNQAILVKSPSRTGLVLIRRFAPDKAAMQDILQNQSSTTCGKYS